MSVVKKILLVLAVIVAVFCAMGAFFLFTTTGFQSLVKIAQLSFPDFAVVESNAVSYTHLTLPTSIVV